MSNTGYPIEKRVREIVLVVAMAALMALNYVIFIFPNSFAPAGLNGIATMVQYKLGFSVGYMNLLINVPLCLIACFVLNRDYAVKTLIFSIVSSTCILLLQRGVVDVSRWIYRPTENGVSSVLAPIAAGTVNGFIYGTVIRQNACTGGTDVVAAFVHKRRPEQSVVWIIFILNSIVALASFFVYDYRYEPVILCIIYCFLSSRISDQIIRGGKKQLKFEITTHHAEEMAQEIIQTLHHSATVMPARGMYSGKPTDLLVCVINKHQIIEMQKIISHYPDSFACVGDVDEVFGNFRGWREIEQREREGLYRH